MLVDLLNDFLDEKGKLAPRIAQMLAKTDLKTHLSCLIAGARSAGVKIIQATKCLQGFFRGLPFAYLLNTLTHLRNCRLINLHYEYRTAAFQA